MDFEDATPPGRGNPAATFWVFAVLIGAIVALASVAIQALDAVATPACIERHSVDTCHRIINGGL